ncbi:hypothetical protein H072_2895 [Dactylellina haptotyla CBS 200.50]|uniref:F-box domain-containing protein n=1 Tax=Dactylellina haptotyla (strain CBS 200.50) TaxID=1284197 RepID=S8AJH3_DACHA|nr:hypothetical protein H072_2895 [Dactylellina haptotyla CBS 200.50]
MSKRFSSAPWRPGRPQLDSTTSLRPSVFQIPELLELILLELPAVTVLTTCRRVSKTWKTFIETSTPLWYYSTTGWRFSQRQHTLEDKVSSRLPSQFTTPMAVEVLSTFWKKLAAKGIDQSLQVTNEPPMGYEYWSPFVHGTRNPLAAMFYIMTLPMRGPICAVNAIRHRVNESKEETNRRKLRSDIKRLYKQFDPVTRLIPFTEPELEKSVFKDIGVLPSCNWVYVQRDFGPDMSGDVKRPSNVENPWANLLHLMVRMAYYRSPKQALPPDGLWNREIDNGADSRFQCDLVYECDVEPGMSNLHTDGLVFSSHAPFDVRFEAKADRRRR